MRRPRSGFTLTELLVTMGIAITLVAAALPMVKFNLEEGKVREASRQVNGFLAKAKARAALTGLPAGVFLERDSTLRPNRVTNLYLAEVPSLFIGSQQNSRVIVNSSNRLEFVTDDGPMATPQKDSNTLVLLDNMLTPDKSQTPIDTPFGIRFDFKGPIYIGIARPTGSAAPDAWTFELQSFPAPVPRASPRGYPFEFARQPQRVNNEHVELPKGTFIAMESSGMGGTGTQLNSSTNAPAAIMFSAGGSFSSLYVGGGPIVPDATLHLLVGRERAENNAPQPVDDPTSLWVSVGTISGAIRTADNAPMGGNLMLAREFAIKHDVKGGR